MTSKLSHARQQLLEKEALRSLGLCQSAEFPEIALTALEAGLESKHLIEIAGLNSPALYQVEPLWLLMLDELKLPRLTESQAAHLIVLPLARIAVERYLRGEMDALATLATIENLNFRYGHRNFLERFCSLHDTWANFLESKPPNELASLEKDLKAAATALMQVQLFDPHHPEKTDVELFRRFTKERIAL